MQIMFLKYWFLVQQQKRIYILDSIIILTFVDINSITETVYSFSQGHCVHTYEMQ